jgi:hypothetical protein
MLLRRCQRMGSAVVVVIPSRFRRALSLGVRDVIAFTMPEPGVIQLRKIEAPDYDPDARPRHRAVEDRPAAERGAG